MVDGPDVAVLYQLLIDHPAGALQIADWYRVDGEKIVEVRTVFDTAPFQAAQPAPAAAAQADGTSGAR